jgi:Zn-dependent protease
MGLLRGREKDTLMPAMKPETLTLGLVWYVAFLFSTVCHEGAHALAAKLGGDMTAAEGGQVSLNPIPHIRRSPWGLVVFPIISYALFGWMVGYASAPYDPTWARQHPKRAAWMALAGPAANFVLMLLAAAAIHIGIASGHFQAPDSIIPTQVTVLAGGGVNLATTFVSVLFTLNLLLGVFNLLPVPPLDGNVGVTVFMSESTAVRFLDWTRSGQYGLLGLVVAWYLFDKIFWPIFTIALRLLYPGMGYR